MMIDGSKDSDKKIESMLHWDLNNVIARRSWARNEEANIAIKRAMKKNTNLKVTLPNICEDEIINNLNFK